MEDRINQKAGLVAEREITQIFSKGTYNNISKDAYEQQYVMAICKNDKNNFGICYFDISTFKCYLGSFDDSPNCSMLRTVLSQVRPVEVIYDKDNIGKDLEKMIKSQPIQPVINVIPTDKVKSIQRCQNSIDKYLYNAEDEQKGETCPQHTIIFDMRWQEKYFTAIRAFGLSFSFLEISMLQNTSIKFFEYQEFKTHLNLKAADFMIMDS